MTAPADERPPKSFFQQVLGQWPLASVLAGVEARTWLAEHSDEDLLDLAWRAADDVHEERHTLPGATDPSRILWHQGSGLRRSVPLTTALTR